MNVLLAACAPYPPQFSVHFFSAVLDSGSEIPNGKYEMRNANSKNVEAVREVGRADDVSSAFS